MVNPAILGDVGKAKEDEFFHRKERELRAKLHARRALGEAAGGVADDAVLGTLEELGYTRETVKILYLVPLLEVAWADGDVSEKERALVLEAAALRGVTEGTPAFATLLGWLDRRPDAHLLQHSRSILADLLEGKPEEDAGAIRRDVLRMAEEVAAASGGFLGFGTKVNDEEREALARLAKELAEGHPGA
jgi:hypothetical protein